MDQDKPESSKGLPLWSLPLVVLVTVVLTNLPARENAPVVTSVNVSETIPVTIINEPDFSLVIADGDHNTNTCWFENKTLFNETVTVVYPDQSPDDDVIGRWDSNTNTMSLMQPGGLDVQTVAHEVSHMVDSFMAQQPNIDPHYEAYMQGFWTWCVYSIMIHDLNNAI